MWQAGLDNPPHLAEEARVAEPVDRGLIFPGTGAFPDDAVHELALLTSELGRDCIIRAKKATVPI